MKRKALGKGLRSLIPEAPPRTTRPVTIAVPRAEGLVQVDIDQIHPNPRQPREHFDQELLQELARSLKNQGVLQPVVVRPRGDGEYELVAGERRWRAAQLAGILKLPAVVKEVSDNQLLELALIENLQRQELNPLETAGAYQMLVDDLDLSQQEVADRVGKQRSTITNALRLLNLPREVQELIRDGQLSAGHAKALAAVTNTKAQIDLARRFADEGVSVRQAEALVTRTRSSRSTSGPATPVERDPNVVAAEERLQQALGTRTRIVHQGNKGGGRVEIEFHSADELERLFDLLT